MSQSPPPASASPNSPQCALAPYPFNQPSADLILRTADGVDFRVHSPILAQASPFFATMLTLPQPADAKSPSSASHADAGLGKTPIIPVSEDSATLELLLRIIYPISKHLARMDDPQTAVPALRAASKYEMELPVEMISERLIVIMPKKALEVWAAACRTGLESVARQAAKVLKASWTKSDTAALSFMGELGDMAGISAGDYYRLKQFLTATDPSTVAEGVFALLSPSLASPRPQRPPGPAMFSTDLPSIDVTCRASSRDGAEVLYPAHQAVLSIQSPALKARLAECRASAGTNDSSGTAPIVLEFEEEPGVVSALLGACYEDEEALPVDAAVLADVAVASQKYGMSRVASKARTAWDATATLYPLEAYFVAVDRGLAEWAKEAARKALGIEDVYVPVMDGAPARRYHRLLEFCDQCRQAVKWPLQQAIDRIPTTIHLSRGSIAAPKVMESLKTIALTGDIRPEEAVRKALGDAVTKAGENVRPSGWGGPTADGLLQQYVYSLLQCAVSAPREADEAWNGVKLVLG